MAEHYGVERIYHEEEPRRVPAERETTTRRLSEPEQPKERERLHATMKGEGRLRRRIR